MYRAIVTIILHLQYCDEMEMMNYAMNNSKKNRTKFKTCRNKKYEEHFGKSLFPVRAENTLMLAPMQVR